jgi:hypothetical protein
MKVNFEALGELRDEVDLVIKGAKKDAIEDIEDLRYTIRGFVLDRVEKGMFASGEFAEKDYSWKPIAAYKLGDVVFEGEGEEKDMYISGKLIDKGDWKFGSPKKKGEKRKKSGLPKPVPVFNLGYEGWRRKYNGLNTTSVDLSFTGEMLEDFDVEVFAKGVNQYKTEVQIELIMNNEFSIDKKNFTDAQRQWFYISDEELEMLLEENGFEVK